MGPPVSPLPEVSGIQSEILSIHLLYIHVHVHEEIENQKHSEEALAIYCMQHWIDRQEG